MRVPAAISCPTPNAVTYGCSPTRIGIVGEPLTPKMIGSSDTFDEDIICPDSPMSVDPKDMPNVVPTASSAAAPEQAMDISSLTGMFGSSLSLNTPTSKEKSPEASGLNVADSGIGLFSCGSNSPCCPSSTHSSRWHSPPLSPLGAAQRHMRRRTPVGLHNLGNTCFLNAALQALAHAPLLAQFFLHGHFVADLNAANFLGTGGVLATAFAALLQKLFPERSVLDDAAPIQDSAEFGRSNTANEDRCASIAPEDFYESVCNCMPMLGEQRGSQQDAHEVMNFVLDALHEDLNRTRPRPPYQERPEVDAANVSCKGEERYAAEAWHHHLRWNRSILVDLCQGQLRSQVRCLECGWTSVTFDPFLFLSLPLPPQLARGGREPIEAAIREYCSEERLEGSDRWGCPKCGRRVDALKRLSLWKLPVLLLVHLKRFGFEAPSASGTTLRSWKIEGEVTLPMSRLDLNEFVAESSPQKVPLKYDLFAAVDHIGSSSSVGHYTAACRRPEGWWRFDDSQTVFLGRPDENAAEVQGVVGEDNYLLLFQRRDAPPEPELVREQSHQHPANWPHYCGDASEWSFLQQSLQHSFSK